MSDDGTEPERAFRIRLCLLAGAVLYGDLISKGLAQAWLVPAPSWAVLPELDLRLHFFNDAQPVQRRWGAAAFGRARRVRRLPDLEPAAGRSAPRSRLCPNARRPRQPLRAGDFRLCHGFYLRALATVALPHIQCRRCRGPLRGGIVSVSLSPSTGTVFRGRLAPLAAGAGDGSASVSKWRSARRRSARAVGTTALK